MPIDTATLLRGGAFAAVLVLLATAEAIWPRRRRGQSRWRRWTTNIGMIAIGSAALRLLLPILALSMATIAAAKGWGLFNIVNWPALVEVVLAIVLLDLAIYAQHVATHRIPLLWRLHKVHHADRDLDVSSGFRFHPLETIASMGYKIAIVALLGPAVVAVFIFELLLGTLPMFNHANLHLPAWLDRVLRRIVVTPDMHRVHHSTIARETNSNYGFNLALWDHVFGTYRDQPERGHTGMDIGLDEYDGAAASSLLSSLAMPFDNSAQSQARKAPE